ncbi:uncharacterized protein C8A04DRAFT_10801 [Dichotomopilus funicola]|uniref:Uncharacterized protein n=1 Tax=Dichotomopilus funicola TaxID=1934379 RepID=A0AAN6ZPA4_9PEZI|nr:hypothetical protein C8A04DRAFT_10801 [Dichotomopilus funicola]
MAEVIGIIGSSIAVVQATKSLASLAGSLTRLWREIRDVPERINTLLTELEITGAFVDAFEGELLTDAEDVSTGLQQLVILQFRDAHAELASLVEDLRAETAVSAVKGSRRKGLIARTKVALKKDVLDRYERRLRKARDHLELVKDTHLMSVQKRQPELIVAKLTSALQSYNIANTMESKNDGRSAQKSQPELAAARVPSAVQNCDTATTTDYSGLWGEAVDFATIVAEGRYLAAEVEPFSYQDPKAMSPQWLRGKNIYYLQLSIDTSGWKFVFRHYVTVPPTTWEPTVPFNLLRGSWESLMKSFDDGIATPYCVNGDGETLVHRAMQSRPAFVEPLLRMGLDLYHEDGHGHPAYHHALSRYWGSDLPFVHRLFLSQGVYDEVTSWPDKKTADIMLRSPVAFDWLVSTTFQDFYQWPLEHRLAVLSHYTNSLRFPYSRAFGRLFHPAGHFRREELLHYIPSLGFCALQWATDCYFYVWHRWWNVSGKTEGRPPAQGIIQGVAAVVKPPDFTSLHETGSMSGLLATFACALGRCNWAGTVRKKLSNTSPDQDQRIAHDKLLKNWVSDLAAGGMDLEAYGESEKAHYDRRGVLSSPQKPREVLLSPEERIFYAPQRSLNGFTFGPKAEDWNLIWEWHPDPERLAGEFWTLIEDPPLAIPGSWVDEPESFYFTNPRVREKKVWPPPKPVKLIFNQAGLFSE